MRELTSVEIDEVRGAYGAPGAGLGAVAGAAGYLGYASTTGNFSWYGLASNIVTGAATGAVTGPVGAVRAYFAPRVAAGTGAVMGGLESRVSRFFR